MTEITPEQPQQEEKPTVVTVELQQQLEIAQAKAQENWDKALRAMAELENIKRRAERDVEQAHKYALERFADSLLPVLDSLEQALINAAAHELKAVQEGLELTLKMFVGVLTKFGIQVLDPAGEVFNASFHEAMAMQAHEDLPNNTVFQVLQKGYTLNSRLIRPARVIVVKNNPA